MPETGSRNSPYSGFKFLLEIDGVTVASFSECSGLTTETGIIEYREGHENITVSKLPGLKKFANISLKRGFTDNNKLWEWRKKVMEGQTKRQSGSIVLLNEAREETVRWNFRKAWPSRWEGPNFNAKGNEVAIETLELTVESLELE